MWFTRSCIVFFFIKCCDLRQSLQCGRQQRSSVLCVLLPSFPSGWVRENIFQGRVQPLTLEKNSWYFFGQTSFCQKWHLPRSLRQECPPWPSWCLVLAPSARKYSSCHTWQCEPSRHLPLINYQVREAPFWNMLVLYGHCPKSQLEWNVMFSE